MMRSFSGLGGMAAASILFAAGDRPDSGAIHGLAREGGFSVSLDSVGDHAQSTGLAESGCWLELLVSGLTFDLTGLAPGKPAAPPEAVHSFGLSRDGDHGPLQAVTLAVGPHIAGGAELMPVLRTLAGLTAALARLSQARAVAWHDARAWSAPDYFSRAVERWLDGGAFPGLGLAAVARSPDGNWRTEGLSLFTGQEMLIVGGFAGEGSEVVRLALRLMHWLVARGKLDRTEVLNTLEFGPLQLDPGEGGHTVTVRPG